MSRIIELREKLGLSQEEFAKKLNFSRNFIEQVETGEENLPEQTIFDICLKFDVSEEWLRTGEGEMFPVRTNNQKLLVFTNDVMGEDDESFKKKFILALSQLDESDWATLQKITEKLH